MRPVTAILIAVSLFAVGGAGIIAKKAIETRARESAAAMAERQRDVEVLVAARDLSQGRTLKNDDLRWTPWPITTAEAAKVIVRMGGQQPLQHLQGNTLKRNVVAGEPMSDTMVFTPGRGGALMPGLIAAGKRAVGITVTAAATASGFVLPGDRVDVILTIDLNKAAANNQLMGRFATETILSDVRVLAVDQELGGVSSSSKSSTAKKKKKSEKDKPEGEGAAEEVALVGKTVAIEVSQEEAERVLTAQSVGKLALALRSMAEGTEDAERQVPFVTDTGFSKVLKASAGGGIKVIKAGAK